MEYYTYIHLKNNQPISNDKLMTKILKGRVVASTNLLKQQLNKRFI